MLLKRAELCNFSLWCQEWSLNCYKWRIAGVTGFSLTWGTWHCSLFLIKKSYFYFIFVYQQKRTQINSCRTEKILDTVCLLYKKFLHAISKKCLGDMTNSLVCERNIILFYAKYALINFLRKINENAIKIKF